jgi:ABC-type bacteriocin/lantibiotic exporter with double-glycine peptidase domain
MINKNSSSIKAFWMYMHPYMRYFYIGITFNSLVGITQLAIPVLLRYILDAFSNLDKHIINITMLIIIICSTFLLNSGLKLIKSYYFNCFAEYTIRNIKMKLVRKLVSFPLSYYDKNISGDLFSRINTDANCLENVYSENIATAIYQPLIILVCTADLFYINWKLAGLIILIIPPIVMVTLKFAYVIKNKAKQMLEKNSMTNIILQEILQMVQTIKIFNGESKAVNKYSKSLNDTVKASLSISIYRIGIEGGGSFILLFGVFIVLKYATSLLANNIITLGQLGEFLVCLIFVGNAFSSLASTIGTIQKSSGAAERLSEIMNTDEEDTNKKGKEIKAFRDRIVFNNVSFSYPSRPSITILDNVNLQIENKEKIGIIGESGSGKSSLINLLLNFYKANSGEILIDGNNIDSYKTENYRDLFSVVSQNIKLFSGTIKENILYGAEKNKQINIKEICSLAGCDFIEDLPNGLNTEVGEDGVTLSGGQRQRITLARAIVKDPQILILDEATSALDATTESVIINDILQFSKNKTLIVLTHGFSILKYMDRIYKVEDKTVSKIDKSEIYSTGRIK